MPMTSGRRRLLFARPRGFSPAQVAGLQLWLRADGTLWQDSARTTPATDDTHPVGAWDDASGNGRHATQATAASRPTLKLAVRNGRNVLRFDGTDDWLRNLALGALFAGSDVPFTVAFVGVRTTTLSAGVPWSFGSSASSSRFHYLVYNAGTSYGSLREDDAGLSANRTGGTPDANWHAVVLVFAGTTVSLYVDGAAVVDAQAMDVGALTSDQFTLGARGRSAADFFFTGDVGELLAYDSALPAAPRQQIESYLRGRWATP